MTTTTTRVSRLWLEGRGRPEFLATESPALSWQVEAAAEPWGQIGSRIELRRGDVVEATELESSSSQHVAWPFSPLTPYDDAEVRVRVRGDGEDWGTPSEWERVRTAALAAEQWTAPFIASPEPVDESRRPVRFRTVFTIDSPVRSAVLSATAHGVYETVLNGEPASDEILAPGWTAYEKRLLFQTHDVTSLLREGPNVLGATVAEGWYRERFGFNGRFSIAYPGPVALSLSLRIEHESGEITTVTTGSDWSTSVSGPTVSASIYQGEHYDARAEDDAFALDGDDFADARPAQVVESIPVLEPAALPPVRRIERVSPIERIVTPSGKEVLDFGQNLVGWLEITVDAPAGAEITLRHAEVLEDGELGVRPLRFASATDIFVADGGARTWSPRFTFHGFRYAEITGWAGEVPLEAITAVVIHSDLERTGWLETSDPMLNQLHSNVLWGMRGNFLSIPTDCPQRDERLGWTGDIQVFAPTASYLYDVSGFLRSWLRDLALEQTPSGVPMVVPSPLREEPRAAAAWGDAATLVPDTLFARYGDVRVLEEQYESMRTWVETLKRLAGEDHLWTGTFQFGDWLDPAAPPDRPSAAKTDADIVATAYHALSMRRLAAAAELLGRDDDAREYGALAEEVRKAFVREYVTGAGRMMSDAHTAYGLAIEFGLVEGEQRQRAGDRLAELVRAYGYRIRTGFVGTPLICDALTATGHLDTAYRLLLERGNPSWLYPITMGATTIWERWDSMLPDGSINPGEMTSFNHYALGAVADWMQRTIGGIAPVEPGYRVIGVRPQPGGGLTSASAALDTGYGRVETSWTIADGRFSLELLVPAGAEALVVLPGGDREQRVGSGRHQWTVELPASRPTPRSFDMDSPLADFVEDPEARSALEAFFGEIGYFIGFGWNDMGAWRSDARLSSSLIMFPREHEGRLQSLLEDLNAAR